MLLRDLIEQAFGSLVAQQAPEWAESSADLLGFVVNPQLPEFRARNGNSFMASIRAAGGNVSPSNVVLFNPATSKTIVVLQKIIVAVQSAQAPQMLFLAADPALAAGAAGLNKFVTGPAPKAITENADAATPTNTGHPLDLYIPTQTPTEILYGAPIVLPPQTGIDFQWQTTPSNYQVVFVWDELPL